MADEGILRLHSFKNRINDIKENLLQIMKKAGKKPRRRRKLALAGRIPQRPFFQLRKHIKKYIEDLCYHDRPFFRSNKEVPFDAARERLAHPQKRNINAIKIKFISFK